jgi:hypothetical protein
MKEKTLNVNTENQASAIEKAALEVFGDFVETAKKNFMNDGECAPVVFIGIGEQEKLGMIIMPAAKFMESVETKDRLSDLMIQIGKNRETVCIIMITEAWMSHMDKEMSEEELHERYKNMPPSKDPDRIEQLMCTFESENIQKNLFFKISRNPLGLEEFPYPEGASVSGRFANVLRDMKKVRNN